MPNSKIKEIQVGEAVYDVSDKTHSLVSNGTNTGIPYIKFVSFDTSTGTLNVTKEYLHWIESNE